MLVLPLDEQPVILFFARLSRHPDKMPAPEELFAVDAEFEVSLLHSLLRINERLPPATIPEKDSAAAIFILWDRPFEITIFERVILGLDRQTFLARHEAWALGHGPAFQHAIHFQTKIVMQPARIMFLDEIAVALRGRVPALRFRGFREIALLPVFLQRHLACLPGLVGSR